MSHRISRLKIDKLKGLEGLDISFEDKNVTAILGVNGCGKSTILHALACMYKGVDIGSETNYFTKYFKKVGGAAWAGSHMTAYFTIDGNTKSVVYEKAADRWKPRIDRRYNRNSYFFGIDGCVPSIEKESATTTSYTMVAGAPIANRDTIIREVSTIMGRTYADYGKMTCKTKNYKNVGINGGIRYTSLSMGAGEQRIFSIVERLFEVPEESLLLIDELDLTMHTVALHRLLDLMVRISNERNLQIVFTTHREEVAHRTDINIRHIWKPSNQNTSLCLEQTDPMCMYRLTGTIEKPLEVYVEDDLAEAIVKSVLRSEGILNYTNVYVYGDATNAFTVAAGLRIQGALSENQLIIVDGDVYRTDEQKEKMMKKRYAGNEAGKDEIRREAIQRIKQLQLPAGEQPEHYLWTMLKTKQGTLAEFANSLNDNPADKHSYIYDIYQLQGESRPIFLKELIDTLQTDPAWSNYVADVQSWAQSSKIRLGLA